MKSPLILGLILVLAGFAPLFGGPRYEAALLAGLLAPAWVAVNAARRSWAEASQMRRSSAEDGLARTLRGGHLLLAGVTTGAIHVGVILLVALVHGLRVGFCEPSEGFALLALGPGLGVILASVLGSIVGAVSALAAKGGSGTLVAALLAAVSFPLGSAALGLLHFHASPAVYAYDPFVGYFSGPLFDTVVYDIERLLSFRAGTLMTILALAGLGSSMVFRFQGDKRGTRIVDASRERLTVLFVGVACSVGSVWHSLLAEELGHSSSAESIRGALGRSTSLGRCTVYFSKGVDEKVAQLTAAECVGHLAQLERYFEIDRTEPVDVYLFSSAEEKRRQMGAARTYIAKPWRREIYLQPSTFPHQVLGHELAHVVTGDFGAGPMKIAGLLGGLVPDPGRIEGFAEAAAPKEHTEGTLHEWTAAMKKLELLPSLHSLFRLTFLGNSPARSYSAAGSFVDFVHEKHGAQVLKDWYGGASLEELTGSSWPALEKEWHSFLDATQVSPEVLEIARPRFSRPAVFDRKCPHAVDRLVTESQAYCPLQETKARRIASEAIELDPQKKDLELYVARCGFYSGDGNRAIDELSKGAALEDVYDPGARRAAYEFAGNIAWNEKKIAVASKLFEEAQKLTYRRGQRRNLEAKLWALKQPPPVRDAVRAILAPGRNERQLPIAALTSLADGEEQDAFGKYLMVRLAHASGINDFQRMSLIKAEELPLESVRRELSRMRFLSSCESLMRGYNSRFSGSLKTYQKLNLSAAERFEAERVEERCLAVQKVHEVAKEKLK